MMEIVGSGVLMGLVVLVVGNILIFISGEGGVGGVITSIFGLFILYFSVQYVEKEKVTVYKQELIGVRSGSEVHGNLFLLQSSDNYMGWKEEDGGGDGIQKLSMDASSIVYEDDNVTPHYVEKRVRNQYFLHDYYDNCRYEIHVPTGSVKTEFNIE